MSTRTRNLTFLNAAWMAFVWVTRIRNAAGDDTLTTGGRATAYILSAGFLAGAATLAVVAARRGPERAVAPIAVAHAAIWVLRGTQIALGDRGVAFKAVHVVLAIASIALATVLVRSTRRAATNVPTPV
jgi:hypothetical protein